MAGGTRLALAVSTAIYCGITWWLGRHILAQPGSVVASDAGDPLLTASILAWNATHVPLTDDWWQFPIFAPTRDALAFSEHLLGLSLIATPLYWLTNDALVTYNLVFLSTFPLCALAMYALVHRLTGNAAGAFVAGLAFGFAPYRAAQLSHIQFLAVFWAPLAFLGLHGYLESGRRRWLVLYGGAWLLQSATSGYLLVHMAILTGLWTVWFGVWQQRWRAVAAITVTTAAAVLLLAPVLTKYTAVHAVHGFTRTSEEASLFSADLAAPLCANDSLVFWGWLRAGCVPEGTILREVEIFPGAALVLLCLVYLWRMARPSWGASPRLWRRVGGALLAVGSLYAAALCVLLVNGPWVFDAGPLHVTMTSVRNPLVIGTTLLALGALPWAVPAIVGILTRDPTTGYYLAAAGLTWLLALGPVISFLGAHTMASGPYAWLLPIPGIGNLRVPARFWMSTVLALSVVAGISLAELLRRRRTHVARALVVTASLAVLSDGWLLRIPVAPAPQVPPAAEALEHTTVLELPPDGSYRDIAAVFRAVRGRWSTVNGYSGYFPNYYDGLRYAARAEAEDLLTPFRDAGELRVLVPADASRLTALVERQPAVEIVARDASLVHYRLPRTEGDSPLDLGTRIAIARLESPCATGALSLALDEDERSRWSCVWAGGEPALTVDLGSVQSMGVLIHSVGPYHDLVPVTLRIETSEDGNEWSVARTGGLLEEIVRSGLRDPKLLRMAIPLGGKRARYVRLAAGTNDPSTPWAIAELEVWSGRP